MTQAGGVPAAFVSEARYNVLAMADVGDWTVEFYMDDQGREPCREWAEGLSPQKNAALRAVLKHVLIPRGLGVLESEYGKALGRSLYELRIRWTAAEIEHKATVFDVAEVCPPENILLRVFFATAGRKIILLIHGYDKAEDPGDRYQNKQIQRARAMLTAYNEGQKRGKRQGGQGRRREK
jgi:hypothetical protein